MKRPLLILVGMLLSCGIFATGARSQTTPVPCCSITAIDAKTGIISANENANGAAFQFRLADAKLLLSLRVGQPVYANFGAKQISLDGKSVGGTISSGPKAVPPAAPAASRDGQQAV